MESEENPPAHAFYQALGHYVVEFSQLCSVMSGRVALVPGGGISPLARQALDLASGELTAYPLSAISFALAEDQAADLSENGKEILKFIRNQVVAAVTRRNDLLHGAWTAPWTMISGTRVSDEQGEYIGYEEWRGDVIDGVLFRSKASSRPSATGSRATIETVTTHSLVSEVAELTELRLTVDDTFAILQGTEKRPVGGELIPLLLEDCYQLNKPPKKSGKPTTLTYTGPHAAGRIRADHFMIS